MLPWCCANFTGVFWGGSVGKCRKTGADGENIASLPETRFCLKKYSDWCESKYYWLLVVCGRKVSEGLRKENFLFFFFCIIAFPVSHRWCLSLVLFHLFYNFSILCFSLCLSQSPLIIDAGVAQGSGSNSGPICGLHRLVPLNLVLKQMLWARLAGKARAPVSWWPSLPSTQEISCDLRE